MEPAGLHRFAGNAQPTDRDTERIIPADVPADAILAYDAA
jgi:hypothetical protein